MPRDRIPERVKRTIEHSPKAVSHGLLNGIKRWQLYAGNVSYEGRTFYEKHPRDLNEFFQPYWLEKWRVMLNGNRFGPELSEKFGEFANECKERLHETKTYNPHGREIITKFLRSQAGSTNLGHPLRVAFLMNMLLDETLRLAKKGEIKLTEAERVKIEQMCSGENRDGAILGALMHDVGKANWPAYMHANLRYGDNMTKRRPIIRKYIAAHEADGAKMLRRLGFRKDAIEDVAHHHSGATTIAQHMLSAADKLEVALTRYDNVKRSRLDKILEEMRPKAKYAMHPAAYAALQSIFRRYGRPEQLGKLAKKA